MKRRETLGGSAATARSAPPARASSQFRERPARTNLAQASTCFVGRRRELSELRTLSSNHPLVTVVGPPGCGKTRLAMELGRALGELYAREGGTWCIDLAEAEDIDSVVASLARTLGLAATGGARPAPDALSAALSARPPTLALLDAVDECKQSLSSALAGWVAAAPQVRWVATARAPLGVEGEGLLNLSPLPTSTTRGGTPDAVRLFVDRARRVRPDWTLDAAAAHDVLEIVRLLAGHPLAIELAAARGYALTVAQILDRQAASHDLCLEATIEDSVRLLEPCQRDALAQMSVFAGGFDVEAAEAVIELSGHPDAALQAIDVMGALCDRALLATKKDGADARGARWSLHESVRRCAADDLTRRGGTEAAVRHHARHYASRGRSWAESYDGGSRAREALTWLGREAENLLAVHHRMLARGQDELPLAADAALALDPLLSTSGPCSLRLRVLGACIASPHFETLDAVTGARLLQARSEAYGLIGHQAAALENAHAALARIAADGTRGGAGRALRWLGTLELTRGRLVEARELLEQARTIDHDEHQRVEEGRAMGALGRLLAREGRLDAAVTTLEGAMAIHGEAADLRYEALDTAHRAAVAHRAGHLGDARAHGGRALDLCREAGDRRLEASVLGLLAAVAHESDQTEAAQALYAQALAMHAESDHRKGEGILLGQLGVLRIESGELSKAREALARSLSLLRESTDPRSEAFVLGALSALEAREGCLDSARDALARAAERATESPRPAQHEKGWTKLAPGLDERDIRDEPPSRAALHLWRGHIEVALARQARREGDEARAALLLDAARDRLEGPPRSEPDEVHGTVEMRMARRALGRAIERATHEEPATDWTTTEAPPLDAPAEVLVVCAHGRWFRPPHGEVVSLTRWGPLQRLLGRLAERRQIAPGEPLAVEALIAAGWPGKQVSPMAGATRVYTAIASLRRLGLRDVLDRADGGYVLRTDVPIARISPG